MMHFTHFTAAIAAFSSLTVAAPFENSDGSVVTEFTVDRQDTGNKRFRSGPLAMAKALEKFGQAIPTELRLAADAAAAGPGTGTVAADPERYDSEYLSPVQIGTPPQTVMLDFDTGSSDLWVFSGQLSTSQQAGHGVYRPAMSSSAQRLQGQSWKIQYGDQSGAAGNVFADKVVIGGVTATRQAVEAATSISAQFQQDQQLDGILGLGGPRNNQVTPTQQSPFFKTVRGGLNSALFAAYLRPGTSGAYDFGFANPNHYQGEIYYAPADRSGGFWGVNPEAYSVGTQAYGAPGKSIVDTGTSLIFAPNAVYQNYWRQVPSAQYIPQIGGVIFDCTETLPDFSLTLGGSKRTVPGEYINYAPNGDGTCFGGLQSASGLPFGILGDVFIKSQYVVFNAETTQIGFADQK